jgi:hypothetical protein
MSLASRPERDLLRHTVATLAYRGAKAVRGAPAEFAAFEPGPGARSPAEILAHVGDLLDWALHLCRGESVWKSAAPAPWEAEIARFHESLARLDEFLASEEPLRCPAGKLFQGPVADALTHVGQLTMLRRLAGAPVRGENYFRADIEPGRVGSAQAPSNVEFD